MLIREYISSDCEQIAELFYQTVHTVNAKDYAQEQLCVWATGHIDLSAWNKSFLEHNTRVAVKNGIIVGFGDIDKTGYLDRLYVHKDYQRQGVATALCNLTDHQTHAGVKRGSAALRAAMIERLGQGYDEAI